MTIKVLKKDADKAFSFLAGINRSISPGHVSKLAESVRRMGVIRPVIVANISFITGKKEAYIIDGQHLFNALLRLNMDIPYVVLDKGVANTTELIETIALLNASSKSWALTDYATAWSYIIDDYKKLLNYYQIYDLELSSLGAILGNRSFNEGGSHNSESIKKGTFRIVNEEACLIVLDRIRDVLSILPRVDRNRTRTFVKEYVNFVKGEIEYNHKTFLANFKKEKAKFTLAIQQEEELGPMFKRLLK